jgi:hypothetical protein
MHSAAHIVFITSVHRRSIRPNSTQSFYSSQIPSYCHLSVFCFVLHKYSDSPSWTPNLVAVNVAATGSITQTQLSLRSIASLPVVLHVFALSNIHTVTASFVVLLLASLQPQCLGKRNPSDCHTEIALSHHGHTLCASFGFLGVCCCAPHCIGDRQHISITDTFSFHFCFIYSTNVLIINRLHMYTSNTNTTVVSCRDEDVDNGARAQVQFFSLFIFILIY